MTMTVHLHHSNWLAGRKTCRLFGFRNKTSSYLSSSQVVFGKVIDGMDIVYGIGSLLLF